MVKDVKIVIGANYGDEGKGLVTNYFCKQITDNNQTCAVMCTNGGAQRGHTVCLPSGIRHVFHHFGSGTFSGADTFFSPNFIINPMQFAKEYKELKALGFEPKSYFMSYCNSITTPFDMILNQIIEEHRGKDKHGSTGMGIWETLLRQYNGIKFNLRYILYEKKTNLYRRLLLIRDKYILQRLKENGIETIPDKWKDIIYSDKLIHNFFCDISFLLEHTKIVPSEQFIHYDAIIFENGQGLLLNHDIDPIHSTPSNTGARNINLIKNKDIVNSLNITDIELCYVTRTYLTRHGAGPFPEESSTFASDYKLFDKTNIYNPFQEHIRYGMLNNSKLIDRIVKDFNSIDYENSFSKLSLAITHTNEYDKITNDSRLNIFNNVYTSDNEYDLKKFNLNK